MATYAVIIGYVLALWWASTAAILFLDRLPRKTFALTVGFATVVAIAAFYGLWVTRDDATPTGALIAFTCTIAIWGWNEILFLTGWVTGSRRSLCPPDAVGFVRFKLATQTVIHHELAVFASMITVAALTWSNDNSIGLAAFAMLWLMRLSTKLNIFLGVPNPAADLLPSHLTYLASYFRTRPLNGLFPFSVTAGTITLTLIIASAFAPGAGVFDVASAVLLAALCALGVLEHWFLLSERPASAMWRVSVAAPATAYPAASFAAEPFPEPLPFVTQSPYAVRRIDGVNATRVKPGTHHLGR